MKTKRQDMLSILRSRSSLVALLCALVLSRMPAPVFAEDAISALVQIEESTAIAVVVAAHAPGAAVCDSPIAIPTRVPTGCDAPDRTIIKHSALRL